MDQQLEDNSTRLKIQGLLSLTLHWHMQ